MIAPHGFQNVESDNGFLFEVQPGIVNSPARIGVGRQMEDLFNALKVWRRFFKIQKIESMNFEPGIRCMMSNMFAPAR